MSATHHAFDDENGGDLPRGSRPHLTIACEAMTLAPGKWVPFASSAAFRALHDMAADVVRDPELLRRVSTGFPISRFKGRHVIDADTAGLALNTLLAVSAGARHVDCVCPSAMAATCASRIVAANGVEKFVRVWSLDDWRRQQPPAPQDPGAVSSSRVVLAPFVPLVTLEATALAFVGHVVAAAAAIAGPIPALELRPTVTLSACLAYLPGHQTKCLQALDLTVDAHSQPGSDVNAAASRVPVPRADKGLDNLLGMLDYSSLPLVQAAAVSSAAWRIAVSSTDLPAGYSTRKSVASRTMDWWQVASAIQRGDYDILVGSLPFAFDEPLQSSDGTVDVALLGGRSVVLWTDVATYGMSPDFPLSSRPTEPEGKRAGRAQGKYDISPKAAHDDEAAARFGSASIVPPTVLFVDDDVAAKLTTKTVLAASSSPPPRPRNTLRARQRQEALGLAGPTATQDRPASRLLEGYINVVCPSNGAGSVRFEITNKAGEVLSVAA
jgi:hypothetical protein